jgi:hypothetical protein
VWHYIAEPNRNETLRPILVSRFCGSFLVSWKRRFDRPVILPDGQKLRTLDDARRYILTLSQSEHETTAWQVAIESLLLAADHPAGVPGPERPAL